MNMIERKKLTTAIAALEHILSIFETGKYSGIPVDPDISKHIEKAKKHLDRYGNSDVDSGLDHIIHAFARIAMAISVGGDAAGSFDGEISVPIRPGDAGYDVKAKETTILQPGRITMVDIGLRLCMRPGLWFKMSSRSSLTRRGCFCVDNTIDATYSGKLFVPVFNASGEDVTLLEKERFAQIVFYNTIHPSLKTGLEEIDGGRGEKGFGSSGRL